MCFWENSCSHHTNDPTIMHRPTSPQDDANWFAQKQLGVVANDVGNLIGLKKHYEDWVHTTISGQRNTLVVVTHLIEVIQKPSTRNLAIGFTSHKSVASRRREEYVNPHQSKPHGWGLHAPRLLEFLYHHDSQFTSSVTRHPNCR